MPDGSPIPAAAPSADDLVETMATACQIIAETGLSEHVLGHVSMRLSADQFLVRCRGPRERGLAYTTADDMRSVSLDGTGDFVAWTPPSELPIHAEILRARPDVTAVVHVHPPAVVAMSVAGLEFRPIIGAYDIPTARLAANGIPVWPRAVLVNTAELGRELAAFLQDRPVAVLRGHGLVSVAGGPPKRALAQAVIQAYGVDALAKLTLAARSTGAVPEPISQEDLDQLPDLGAALNLETMWRHLSARAAGTRSCR